MTEGGKANRASKSLLSFYYASAVSLHCAWLSFEEKHVGKFIVGRRLRTMFFFWYSNLKGAGMLEKIAGLSSLSLQETNIFLLLSRSSTQSRLFMVRILLSRKSLCRWLLQKSDRWWPLGELHWWHECQLRWCWHNRVGYLVQSIWKRRKCLSVKYSSSG